MLTPARIAEPTFPVELLHPCNGEPLGVTFTLQERSSNVATGQAEDELASMVVEWQLGGHTFGDVASEFSTPAVRKVVRTVPWVAEQVDAAVAGHFHAYWQDVATITEAARVVARYDTIQDADGDTRRSRNDRFGSDTPTLSNELPLPRLWAWFWQLSRRREWRDGYPVSLQFADIAAWLSLGLHGPTAPSLNDLSALLEIDSVWRFEIVDELSAIANRSGE